MLLSENELYNTSNKLSKAGFISEKLPGKTIRNYADGSRPEGKYNYIQPIEDEEDITDEVDDDYVDPRLDTELDDPDENGIASLRAAHPEQFDDEGVKDAIMQIAHCDEETAYDILNWAEATNNPNAEEFDLIKDDLEKAEAILAAYNEEDPDYDEDYIQYIDPDDELDDDDEVEEDEI